MTRRWLLVLGLAGGCMGEPAPPATTPPANVPPANVPPATAQTTAPCQVITSEREVEGCVGKTVTLRGRVIRSKMPTMLGVDINLDGTGELPGEIGEATGVLARYVVEERGPDEPIVASRGAGTYYALRASDGNGLAKVTGAR